MQHVENIWTERERKQELELSHTHLQSLLPSLHLVVDLFVDLFVDLVDLVDLVPGQEWVTVTKSSPTPAFFNSVYFFYSFEIQGSHYFIFAMDLF